MKIVPILLVFLIPFVCLLGGFLCISAPPPFRSRGPAYRTAKASLSEDTWHYAHYSFGIVSIFLGFYSAVLAGLTDVILWKVNASGPALWITVILLIIMQLLLLLIPFFYTEQHLKENFDEQGKACRPVRKRFSGQKKPDEKWGTWKEWKDDEDEEWEDWDTWLTRRDRELDQEREEKNK